MTDTPTPPSWATVPRTTVRWSLARVDGDTTDVAVGDKVTLQPTAAGIAVVDPLGPNPVSIILESRTYKVRGDGALVDDQGDMAAVLAVDDPRVATPGGRVVQWIARHERRNEVIRFPAAAGATVELSRWVAATAPESTQRSWAEQLVDAAEDVTAGLAAAVGAVGQAVEDYLTANPPPAAPDATTAAKGLVQLSGDLAGTADAPTVPGLAGKADSDHTHTLADVTDYTAPDLSGYATMTALTSGLAGKADSGHGHAIGDVSGLQPALDGKQAAGSYASASHTHTAGDVSGLSTVATSGDYADLTGTPTIPAAPGDIGAAPAIQPINARTAAYTLVASDAGKLVQMTLTAAADLTVPASVFTAGQRVDLSDRGTARVTVVAGSGMTVNPPPGGTLVMEGRYAYASLVFVSATEADLVGLAAGA